MTNPLGCFFGKGYLAQMPDIGADEVLTPGESCTIQFVIVMDPEITKDPDSSGRFQLSLHYVQDIVEAAPTGTSLLHTHQ